MFENRKDLVSTSSLGGKKTADYYTMLFSLKKNIRRENGNFYKTQVLWPNSCFLATRETRSLHITFIFFFFGYHEFRFKGKHLF